MDKDAEKRYRELSPKEKYDSAIRAGEEPYNPLQTVKDLIKEKEDKQKNTPMGALSQGARMGPALPKGEDESKKELKKAYKKGGQVVKTLKNAGFYNKGKTKSEREKIVSKVTTKPQRIGMVEKMFSAKKMAKGGLASKRADGCAIKGKTRGKIV